MKNLLLLFHRQKVSPAAAKSQDRLAKRLQSSGLFWHRFGQCRPVQNTGNHIRFIIASCSIEILRFYNNKKAFKKKDYFKNQKYITWRRKKHTHILFKNCWYEKWTKCIYIHTKRTWLIFSNMKFEWCLLKILAFLPDIY